MATGYIATKHYNYKTTHGKLAKGCELCVKGEKLVLFVTGVCGNGCPYCPVSDAKNLKDVQYANEAKITGETGLLAEAAAMRATGAGITGGDPLAVMTRTVEYIKRLKKAYGQKFHIHLYTPLLRVNEKNLQRLYDAGLDEIRFHPKLNDRTLWPRLQLARHNNWAVGVEVPAIPEHEQGIKELLDYLAAHRLVDFVNLNEFEYADNEVFEKAGVHHEPKDASSYAVKGSATTAKRLLTHAEKLGIPAHFCTAKSKDAVQLATRIKRRSQQAAQAFDAIDKEGLLTRGAIYDELDITKPGYTDRLALLTATQKQASIRRLQALRRKLIREWDVPEELIALDKERLRLLTTTSVAEAAAKAINTTVALVKEYPTADCLIVEADILRRRTKR